MTFVTVHLVSKNIARLKICLSAKIATRDCTDDTEGLPNGCTKNTDIPGVVAEACFCTTDLCNGDGVIH